MTTHETVTIAGRPGLARADVRRIVAAVLAREQRQALISITCVGLTARRRLNHAFTGRDALTDVLAFELPQPDGSVVGDIYLCPGMAAREARIRGMPRREELVRLVVHATLHVLGYDHPEGDEREASPMWQLQESLVAVLL